MAERMIDAAVMQGARKNQQDYIGHIVLDKNRCVAGVLADGIGGHGNGNYASKIVVESCIKSLDRQRDVIVANPKTIPEILNQAVQKANRELGQKIEAFPQTDGMGATVVIAVVHDENLYWASVGDSLLVLVRKGKTEQLNEVHSLASSLDRLRKISASVAQSKSMGDYSSVLTSALSGGSIESIDCPADAYGLNRDDVIVIASDGIETIELDALGNLCNGGAVIPAQVCAGVVDLVLEKDAPKQDNLSVVAIV